MFINKNFGIKGLMRFSGGHLIWLTAWATIATSATELLHHYKIYAFNVPWLPVSLVGTAVAFYVGFKNNSAYDRLWEARKIWGGIVNTSRMWGANVRGFVGNQFRDNLLTDKEITQQHKRLIYRHIAWLYTLRRQLLVPTEWEHISQSKLVRNQAKRIMNMYKGALELDDITENSLISCLLEDDVQKMLDYKNTATQLIDLQSQDLKKMREEHLIDDFRHMELQKLLNDLYTHQGKAERIKKFPLPRQYGSMSTIFVGIFLFLLPFGLVNVFHPPSGAAMVSNWGAWVSIPFTVIVGWVFLMMELIGDYSENPFEGLGNDIPMLSLCRTIEIDLKEMLGDTDIPKPVESINGVLM